MFHPNATKNLGLIEDSVKILPVFVLRYVSIPYRNTHIFVSCYISLEINSYKVVAQPNSFLRPSNTPAY